MKRLTLSLLVWATSLTAQAQDFDTPCAPEVIETRRVLLEQAGQAGIWFHMEVARCMLGRLAALPGLQTELTLWETRREASEALETDLRRRGDLAIEEATAAREVLDEAIRARRRAEEDLHVWYRNPVFLIGTGAVLVVAIEIVAIIIFKEVSP